MSIILFHEQWFGLAVKLWSRISIKEVTPHRARIVMISYLAAKS